MILVTLGTDARPFERALDLIDRLRPTHELVVQHGHTPARDWEGVTWVDFVPFDTLTSFMKDAEAIVCHAGVGSIMTVVSLGRRPVVIPRLGTYGEHVDDHQLQIVAKLATRGYVVPLEGTDIEAAVEESCRGTVEWGRESRLRDAVVAAVDGLA